MRLVQSEIAKGKSTKEAFKTFESATLIDNPTNVLFNKNSLEVQMSHRFGVVNNNGGNDLVGFWAPSNISIGL